MTGGRSKWFGIAAVTAVPGLITSIAAINGCVGDDPGTSTASADGATSSSTSSSSSGQTTSSSSGATTSSSSGATPDDSGVPPLDPDAAPSLGCPLGCLPPAPMGWVGPSAVYDGTTGGKPAACPAPYTQKEVDGHSGAAVGTTTCDCGAGSNSGAKCTVTASQYTSTDCSGGATATATFTGGPKTCVNRANIGGSYNLAAPVLSGGTCTYGGANVTGPAPTFTKEHVACGLPQYAACTGNASCVASPTPDQPYTRLCIHKDGEESCPSLDYKERFVTYKTLTDDRACSCTGSPVGGACGTAIDNYKGTGCAGGTPLPSTTSNCMSGGVSSSLLDGVTVSGVTCGAGSMSGATGTVKEVDAITFCCNK
jgi:hypothetical protein